MIGHTFNSSTWESEAGGSLGSKPAWSAEQILGSFVSQTLSCKQKQSTSFVTCEYIYMWEPHPIVCMEKSERFAGVRLPSPSVYDLGTDLGLSGFGAAPWLAHAVPPF